MFQVADAAGRGGRWEWGVGGKQRKFLTFSLATPAHGATLLGDANVPFLPRNQ